MRAEVFKLWRLLQKRERLIEDAISLQSPGFEPHYGSSYSTGASFEDKVIAACDLDDEIDQTLLGVARGMEEDDAVLKNYKGQTQRILRLRYLCGKGEDEIASMLGISVRTVDRRIWDKECTDNGRVIYLPIDILIEEHIIQSYLDLERVVGYDYEEVERLIAIHKDRANSYRSEYNAWLKKLDARSQTIFEERMAGLAWDAVAEKVGLSERQARRIYTSLLEQGIDARIS